MKSITGIMLVFMVGLLSFLPSAVAQQKTVAACRSEWQANKADNQAKGITENAYVAQCRAGTAGSPPSASTAGAAAQTPIAPTRSTPIAPSANPAAPTPVVKNPAPAATGAPTGAGEFAEEGQAKGHCPSDTVVWANLTSKVYHFSGHKDYGNTKGGAYMCEKDAISQGFRASKTEKHPA